MTRIGRPLLLLLTGAALLHITLLTDLHLRYVKDGLRPLLIASGAVLVLLGLSALVQAVPRAGRRQLSNAGSAGEGCRPHDEVAASGEDGQHGHDHAGLPRSAWLLLLPALLLLLQAPPPLGAYTAARDSAEAESAKPPQTPDAMLKFVALPASDPVPMPLSEFTLRARHDRKQSLKDRSVQLTGFVTPGTGGSWYLTRLVISCCAADSQARKVEVHGVPSPPADTWVTVTGRWHAHGTLGTPSAANAVDAAELETIPRPASPYTDTVPGEQGYGGV